MRTLVFLLMVSAATTGYSASQKSGSVETPAVDPIVTGQTVTAEHKAKWKAERAKWLSCRECATQQAFPEE